MKNVTTGALFFLAAGILTSVSILSVHQVLIAISITYFTYLAIKNKETQLPKSAYWLLAFTLVALLGLLINFNIVPKPSKNFGRLKYYIFAVLSIFAYRFWLVSASNKLKKFLTSTFLVSIIVAGVASIIQVYVQKEYRAQGLTGIMRYGYGSGMLLMLVLSAILHHKSIKDWFDVRLGIIAFAFGFVGMYLTLTRGSLLGFICAVPFVIYFYRPKIGMIIGGVCFLSISILAGVYLFGDGKYSSRYLSNKNISSDVMRRSQWEAAIIATKEKPFLGWGLSNFHTQLKRIKNENDLEAKWYNDSHAHNLFLEISSGTGLIGLFIFLGWILTWAWESFKGTALSRAFVLPFIVSFIVVSQFEVTFDANNAALIFGLYSLSLAAISEKKTNN